MGKTLLDLLYELRTKDLMLSIRPEDAKTYEVNLQRLEEIVNRFKLIIPKLSKNAYDQDFFSYIPGESVTGKDMLTLFYRDKKTEIRAIFDMRDKDWRDWELVVKKHILRNGRKKIDLREPIGGYVFVGY